MLLVFQQICLHGSLDIFHEPRDALLLIRVELLPRCGKVNSYNGSFLHLYNTNTQNSVKVFFDQAQEEIVHGINNDAIGDIKVK
jgi:hypothetical protein